jgi:hypothetical protein
MCTENPKKCIEVLDNLGLFIDKKVVFENSISSPRRTPQSGAPSAVYQQFSIQHNFSFLSS